MGVIDVHYNRENKSHESIPITAPWGAKIRISDKGIDWKYSDGVVLRDYVVATPMDLLRRFW